MGIVLGIGLDVPLQRWPPIYAEKLYGKLDYTRILAYFQTISNMGGIITPLIMGAMYSRTNSYNSSLLFLLLCLVVAFCIWIKVLPKDGKRSHNDFVSLK